MPSKRIMTMTKKETKRRKFRFLLLWYCASVEVVLTTWDFSMLILIFCFLSSLLCSPQEEEENLSLFNVIIFLLSSSVDYFLIHQNEREREKKIYLRLRYDQFNHFPSLYDKHRLTKDERCSYISSFSKDFPRNDLQWYLTLQRRYCSTFRSLDSLKSNDTDHRNSKWTADRIYANNIVGSSFLLDERIIDALSLVISRSFG